MARSKIKRFCKVSKASNKMKEISFLSLFDPYPSVCKWRLAMRFWGWKIHRGRRRDSFAVVRLHYKRVKIAIYIHSCVRYSICICHVLQLISNSKTRLTTFDETLFDLPLWLWSKETVGLCPRNEWQVKEATQQFNLVPRQERVRPRATTRPREEERQSSCKKIKEKAELIYTWHITFFLAYFINCNVMLMISYALANSGVWIWWSSYVG